MKVFRKSALYRATSLESAAIAVAMLGVASFATPALAQETAPQAAQCTDEDATRVIKSSNYVNPLDTTFEDRLLEELGTPKNEFVWNVDLKVNSLTIGYRGHYISPMYLNNYEDFNGLNNGNALNANPQNADYADVWQYPAVMYHDLRVQWDLKDLAGIGKSFQFYAGVNNVLDKKPPFSLTGIGSGSAIYDFRGRTFYTGFRAGF